MENVPDTALGRMYREHINFILTKNIDALLDQYTDDALLISSFMKEPLYYKGRDQLREHMQGILGIQGLETDIAFWAETEDPQTLMIVEKITMHTPDGDAHIPSSVAVYPTHDWHERETWDFFGIEFDGHPALARIEMPDDWPGHPQRKDYPLGGIPVEYKGATVPPPDQRRSYK